MVERIESIKPGESDKEKRIDPDSKRFQDMMKVEKPGETELEEQKKRRLKKEEEEGKKKEELTPYQPPSGKTKNKGPIPKLDISSKGKKTSKEFEEIPKGKELPISQEFWEEVEENLSPKEKSLAKEAEKKLIQGIKKEKEKPSIGGEEKKVKEKKGLSPRNSAYQKEEEEKTNLTFLEEKDFPNLEESFFPSLTEQGEIKEYLSDKEKLLIEEAEKQVIPPHEKKTEEKQVTPPHEKKIEEKLIEKDLPSLAETHEPVSFRKKTKQEQPLALPFPSMQSLPENVLSQAKALTAKVASFLSPHAIATLFTRMVGTIVYMQQKGVTETMIILNSSKFAGSVFFNAKILIERYATAPDSFNIRLTGTNEAVALFNNNIDGLIQAFKGCSFRIGYLRAEYEPIRPLFRRKSPLGEKGEGQEQSNKER